MNAFVKCLETQLRQCVILSTVYWISQCVADKKFDFPLKEDDFVHVYTRTPYLRPFEKEYGSKARLWIILLGVIGCIVIVIACIFCYFALKRWPGFFRRSPVSHPPVAAGEFHPPPSAPAMEERDSWNRARSQGPPDYTSVTLGMNKLSVPELPQQKLMETPPPEYITIAPFK